MVARVDMEPDAFRPLLEGTHLIDVAEGKKVFKKADGPASPIASMSPTISTRRRRTSTTIIDLLLANAQ